MLRTEPRIRLLALLLLCAAAAPAAGALKLSEERQKVVDRYMDVLLSDPRNEFAFRQVYGAFKAEGKEYLLVNFFQSAIRLEPRKASLHIILGRLYAAFRDLYQAGVKFKDGARLDPKDYYARYLLAEVYFKQRKYEDAAKGYQVASALSTDMDDRVRSFHGLARVYAALERWEDARKTWDEIAELRPYDVGSFQRLAEAARDCDQLDLAERWLKKLLALYRDENEADGICSTLIELGDVALDQKQFEKAVVHYRKAKAHLSESHWLTSEVNARIRKCYAEQDRTSVLRQKLEERVKKKPTDLDALLEVAEALQVEGKTREAAERLKAASAASPRDVQILERYRALLVTLKNDAGVEAASKRLIALSPQNVHYRLQDAAYYVLRGKPDKAKEIWHAIIEEDPDQPARHLSVARAMKRASELDWAEEAYRELIKVAADVEAHKLELAELYLARANELPPAEPEDSPAKEEAAKQWLERCQRYFQKAEELLDGASRRAKLTLAETQWAALLLLDSRRLDATRAILEQGRKRFPEDMGLARMQGETYLRLGATKPRNSKEKNTLYDQAVASYMAAYDLAPHPAIRREMNTELIGLCLGYGTWKSGSKVYRGGPKGLESLVKKHVDAYFARPKDPMPAWCIGDIQQQGPYTYFNFKIKGGPPKGLGIYIGHDRAEAGLSFFSDALQRDPLFIPGYLSKSIAYAMRDSFEQAVIELRKAAVIDPVSKWLYFLQIGDRFANEGQIEEATAFWNRVAERVFTDATIFYQLGCRFFRAEQTGRAVDLLKQAIEANPNIYSYYMTLGNMYDYLGDYPKAVGQYRRALELSTQSMLLPVRQRLSEIQRTWAYDLFDKGETENALKQFSEIRAFQKVLEDYYRQEDDQLSLKRLSPESANVQVQVARCHEALGRPAEAQPIYQRVAGQLPTAPIRITPNREMSLRHFLRLKDKSGRLKPDNMGAAGSMQPRPFKLTLGHHTRLYDVAREHSVTPRGVLYSGFARWVEVDPLTGRVLRTLPAGKAIRYEAGVEVHVLREGEADRIRIVRGGKATDVQSLGNLRVRMTDLQITPDRLYFVGFGGATRVIAVDTGTGAVVWNVSASRHTQDIAFGSQYLVAIESHANRTSVVVRDAASGETRLTKELSGQGLWLAPTVWQDKLFLVDDVKWELHMLDIASGEFDYSLTFHGPFPRSPVLHDGILYLHSRAYKERTIFLYAIVPATGQIRWRTDMQAMSVHSPPIFRGPDIVYLNPETHKVFMIDRQTGARHAEAGYEDLMTKQQRDFIQFLRPFGEHLLIVGGRGDVHAFEVN